MDTDSKIYRQLTGERVYSSARTELSRRRQRESYEQRVRNGDDAVRNNPDQW